MKSAGYIAAIVIAFTGLTATADASPREELNQLTAQLQNNPSDAALREKIITLARTVKPAVPEEARRPFVRGNSAFADAKSPQEFDRAIDLYREASNLAPWWGDVYFNLGKALEQRQSYAEAVTALKLYLLATPGAQDARATQDRIYALEEKAERAGKEAAAKAQADAAKAERRRWAGEIVQWLRTNYGGRLQHAWICGVPGRTNIACTGAEAGGNYWSGIYSQDGSSLDLRRDNVRFGYATTGPDGEQIQVGIGYPSVNTMVCGIASGPGIESVNWSFCDKNISGDMKLRFSRASDGNRPWIEQVNSCQGDLCTRQRYVLEN